MDQDTFEDTFGSPGLGHTMLIRPGEELQYWIESAGNGICHIKLEYTQDGGLIWRTEQDENSDAIDQTGTAGSPLTTLIDIGWVKNETKRNKLYRWNMVSFDAAGADITAHLSNHDPNRVHLSGDQYIILSDDSPVGGTDGNGAHFAGPGSIFICKGSSPAVYKNDGTSTLTIWKKLREIE